MQCCSFCRFEENSISLKTPSIHFFISIRSIVRRCGSIRFIHPSSGQEREMCSFFSFFSHISTQIAIEFLPSKSARRIKNTSNELLSNIERSYNVSFLSLSLVWMIDCIKSHGNIVRCMNSYSSSVSDRVHVSNRSWITTMAMVEEIKVVVVGKCSFEFESIDIDRSF